MADRSRSPPDPRNANLSPAEPRNYNPWLVIRPPGPTDGCVIIRHATTEIGADAQNQPVQVSFMSIYMHLSELRGRPPGGGRRAGSGRLPGRNRWPNGLRHRRTVKCISRSSVTTRISKAWIGKSNGGAERRLRRRMDVLFGEMYFRLPAGTRFFARRPGFSETTTDRGTRPPCRTSRSTSDFVTPAETGQGQRGDAWLTSYSEEGHALGDRSMAMPNTISTRPPTTHQRRLPGKTPDRRPARSTNCFASVA